MKENPKRLQIAPASPSAAKQARTLPLTTTSDALKALRSPLNKSSLARKKNTKTDTIASIIATAHQGSLFATDVVLCDVVFLGVKNEQKKFEDTMKVTQWMIDDSEMKVL